MQLILATLIIALTINHTQGTILTMQFFTTMQRFNNAVHSFPQGYQKVKEE